MKQLNVKILPAVPSDWSAFEKAVIENYPWDNGFHPEAWAQVCYVRSGDEKEGLWAHLFCREAEPYAIYHKHMEPVYEDSCMEFFFTMKKADAPENGYINIESNSDPTTLIAYGPNRYERTPIHETWGKPFDVTVRRTDSTWELFEFVPLAALQKYFGIDRVDEDTVFKANFYKCGGNHEIQPYGSWSPITDVKPNFHCPEFFGELKLCEDK